MSTRFSIPWYRYALITYLAQNLEDISPQFGKTALQKMVYLLQEVFDVPVGYRFSLYNYGPYSPRLTNDLSMAEAMDAVAVSYIDSESGGYKIQGDSGSAGVLEKGREFLSEHSEPIQRVIEEFGAFTARMLELYTTTIFVARDLDESPGVNRQAAFEAVLKLKPYFMDEEIETAIDDLVAKHLIELKD